MFITLWLRFPDAQRQTSAVATASTVVAEAVAIFIMIIISSITECHWAGPSYLSGQRRQILLLTHFIEE